MKFGIVVSKKDEAGMNIARHLDELGIVYVVVDEQTIYEDDLEKTFKVIFRLTRRK